MYLCSKQFLAQKQRESQRAVQSGTESGPSGGVQCSRVQPSEVQRIPTHSAVAHASINSSRRVQLEFEESDAIAVRSLYQVKRLVAVCVDCRGRARADEG